MIPAEHSNRIPQRIKDRLQDFNREVETLIANAQSRFATSIPSRIAFSMSSLSTTGDLITPYERAQSISFVTRYEHLPDNVTVRLVEEDGDWYIGNLWVLRHVLNDFRPIIQNQRDAVYYARVHSVWNRMLLRSDPGEGMLIRALDVDGQDITDTYSRWLTENKRAITVVINGLEFEYLYNGILQHSDADLSRRFLADYVSGELNYLLWKHVRVLGFMKSLLGPYHRMMRTLTFPTLGAL